MKKRIRTIRLIFEGILSLNNPFLSPFLMSAESWPSVSFDPGDGGLELVDDAGEPGYDLAR